MFGIVVFFAFLVAFLLWDRLRRTARRYPPGPKPLPLLGNALAMPMLSQWLTFTRWARKYGDIIHLEALGNHIVVLSSVEAIRELLEKRSSIYSDRPRLPMIVELVGWSWALVFMNYGTWWRKHRKAFQQLLGPTSCKNYVDVQVDETRKFINRMKRTPDDFRQHVRHLLTAMLMRIAYGVQVKESGDKYIAIVEKANEVPIEAGIPGTFLVDIFPILKYVPSWMPGTGFKAKARESRVAMHDLLEVPFAAARDNLKNAARNEGYQLSVAEALIDALKDSTDVHEDTVIARNVSAVMYAGGLDTTNSMVLSFIAAMGLHPDAQRRARAEVDSIVDTDHGPTLEDLERLPYCEAIIKETLRWSPPLHLGVPHRLMSNDEYRGYYIPEGTVVMPNIWAIFRDSKIYADPDAFRPERFLTDNGTALRADILDPTELAFGFGRRECPGRFVAVHMAFISLIGILTNFDISLAKDDKGKDIPISLVPSPGIISTPEPFQCSIRERS